jgi:hypothetical protein
MVHNSLAMALDAVNEALFDGRSLSKAEKEEATRWIASRQVEIGQQAGLFAPTRERDCARNWQPGTSSLWRQPGR